MIAILGSGFGLYGYLPALIQECGQEVVLPSDYRQHISERDELAPLVKRCHWQLTREAAVDAADGVVIALPPEEQAKWARHCLARPNIKRLLLEKPLAESPAAAASLLRDLDTSGKRFRIGYTFRYTDWGEQLLGVLGKRDSGGELLITWTFLAHHFRHDLQNWKRFSERGGGPIRFYGIQLIALLAEAGYNEVISSHSFGAHPNETEQWDASVAGPNLPPLHIQLHTRTEAPVFSVERRSGPGGEAISPLFHDEDPFSPAESCNSSQLDRRVAALGRLCRSFGRSTDEDIRWYEAAIDLWRAVERSTVFEQLKLEHP